jgi:hypothetical protein
MNQQQILDDLFLCDGVGLSCAMSARSGSGKTTLLTRLINDSVKEDRFKNQRFIYASMKQETLFDDSVPIVTSMDSMIKALKKNQIVTFFPTDPERYEDDIDELIEVVFSLSGENDDAGFHITIDDANIMRGFSNRGQTSSSVRKLIIAGRSKGVRSLLITHRLAMLPRMTNSNLSHLVLMSGNSMDSDYGLKVLGIDLKNVIEELGEYRWAVVDLTNEKIHRFSPV